MHNDTITILKQLIGISEELALEHFRDKSLGGTEEKSYLFIMKVLDDAHRHVGKLKHNRDNDEKNVFLAK
jgi:tRNA (Thr-GGU) A37 N-methylase